MNQQLKAFSAKPTYRKSDDVADSLARASAYHRSGDLAKAQAGYKKVLKKRPNHFDALHMLGVCEQQCGNSEAAARSLRRALLLDPKSVAIHSDLGTVLAVLRRFDEALAHCDQAIALLLSLIHI